MKKYKRYLLAALSLSALLLLTGCVSIDKTTKQPTGFVWNLIGKPMGEAINFFATDLGLGFGLGIILVTVIVRIIIFPLGIYQSWKATYQSLRRSKNASKMRRLKKRNYWPTLN